MNAPQNLVVSTCGTSVVINKAAGPLRREINKLTNKTEGELDSAEKQFIDAQVKAVDVILPECGVEDFRKLSAEINGLAALHGGSFAQAGSSRNILIHSDTYLGRHCADLIARWCERQGLNVSTRRVPGLNTAEFASFQVAMSELAHWCISEIAPQRSPHCRVVFNLTGGFKSLQGFMQTLGMFYADEIVYLFETSRELLRIPRLPLNIDTSALDEIHHNFDIFRRLSLQDKVTNLEGRSISETMLFSMEGEGYALSAWGEIFWDRYRLNRYGDRLFPSPLPGRIIFSPEFVKQAERFKNDRGKTMELNERIDDLARFLLRNMRDCPKRLSFKALKGSPVPGSTHEFYAWSTGGAWRVFCHMQGDAVHIDTLREHL